MQTRFLKKCPEIQKYKFQNTVTTLETLRAENKQYFCTPNIAFNALLCVPVLYHVNLDYFAVFPSSRRKRSSDLSRWPTSKHYFLPFFPFLPPFFFFFLSAARTLNERQNACTVVAALIAIMRSRSAASRRSRAMRRSSMIWSRSNTYRSCKERDCKLSYWGPCLVVFHFERLESFFKFVELLLLFSVHRVDLLELVLQHERKILYWDVLQCIGSQEWNIIIVLSCLSRSHLEVVLLNPVVNFSFVLEFPLQK